MRASSAPPASIFIAMEVEEVEEDEEVDVDGVETQLDGERLQQARSDIWDGVIG